MGEKKNNNLLGESKMKKLISRDAVTIYIVIAFYAVYSAMIYSGSAS